MSPLLQLDSVACRRGDRVLFSGLSESLAAGDLAWLRGSNGRGKTSLMRLVAGLAAPEHGRILWRGEPVRRSAAYARERLYIAHGNALKEDLTAAESLAFLARVHGRDADAGAVKRALDRLGLGPRARAPVRTLSQGQRRRVALARLALAPAAVLWILDEPFDALDLASTTLLHELLDDHRAGGGSVLLTSHHLPLSVRPGTHLAPARAIDLDLLVAAGRDGARAGAVELPAAPAGSGGDRPSTAGVDAPRGKAP